MQQAMGQELGQLGNDTAAPLLGLPLSGWNADDDVSKEPTCALAKRSLSLRERENIGRTIVPAVSVVELLDLVVARKNDRELGSWHLKPGEHRFGSAL